MAASENLEIDQFDFGRNWSNFLKVVDENRIESADQSLISLLGVESLEDQTFLDAGCGSGLFSLAATRLGATVTSFDVNPQSVGCALELKRRFAPDSEWEITDGSLLDSEFLQTRGPFDVVYCWGVAHHTGRMWDAIENLVTCVAPGGSLVIAIYNDQLYVSRIWYGIKNTYQRLPRFLRPFLVLAVGATTFLKRLCITLLAVILRLVTLRNPFTPIVNWLKESQSRGMHVWYDLVDWVGGWPFEVAKPEEIFRHMRDRGFVLKDMTTCLGHGCNEFVFRRTAGE